MITHDEKWKALVHLGFDTGWVLQDDEIVLWECEQPIPDDETLEEAVEEMKQLEQQASLDAASGRAKLAALGLTDDEINALLGA